MITRFSFFCFLCLWFNFCFADRAGDLNKLRERIQQMQQELAETEESKSEAADALRESERIISKTNRRLYELSIEQKRNRTTLTGVQNKATEVRTRIDKQQKLLERLLYHQYVTGSSDSLKILLNGQDANQIARDIYYYGEINKFRLQTINQQRQDLASLQLLSSQIQVQNTTIAETQAKQLQEKQQLIKEKQAKHKILTSLSKQIKEQRKEINTLRRDENRLTRLVEKLRKIVLSPKLPTPLSNETVPNSPTGGITFANLKGKLHLPVRGELTNRFGSHRLDGGLVWKGIFIRSNPEQQVKAIADGQVVFADWLRGFGNLLIIDHGQGYMSLYGNNEALYKQVGELVRGADVIAIVGNSGGNLNSGLYFELRHQGKPFDPLTWVSLK